MQNQIIFTKNKGSRFIVSFKGSRWTFQATRMNGETFGGLFTILPDQMQVANPVLILLFIPTFDYVIYPLLRKNIIIHIFQCEYKYILCRMQ